MSSTPRQLIEYASVMLRTASDEPAYRAVCSRAYYGAFHAAKAFHESLPAPGTVGNAKGSHEQLIAQLLNPTVSKQNKKHALSIAIGRGLRQLANARVTSDYVMASIVDKALATKTSTGAEAVGEMAGFA